MEGQGHEVKEPWMNGLAGMARHRSRRVKSSTGRHFGAMQKRSVLTQGDRFNSLQAARDTVSKARHCDREENS